MHPFVAPPAPDALESSALPAGWEAVLPQLPTFGWCVDRAGHLRWAHPEWSQLTGIAPDPDALPILPRLVHAEDCQLLSNFAIADDSPRHPCDYRLACLDGAYRRVREYITPIRLPDGRIWGHWGQTTLVEDLPPPTPSGSDRHNFSSRHQLEALGWLASGVAHDFNNLLTAIRIYADLLRDDLADPAHVDQIDQIIHATSSATFLVQNLETFGRTTHPKPERLDLNQVLDEMRGFLRSVLSESIALRIYPADVPAWVEIDRKQFEQLILNLTLNARNAIDDTGRLTMRLATLVDPTPDGVPLKPGPYVRLSVSDTGCGVHPDIIDRIFEPFFSTRARSKGSGLGLANCRAIAQKAGGEIVVTSPPGEGATFDVWLRALPATVPTDTFPAESAPAESAPTHMMLVEDDDAVRSVSTLLIEALGHRVTAFSSPTDALAASTPEFLQDIALLITDIVMPDMNGLELSRRLQERKPGLRVLFISGYIEDPLTEKAMNRPGVNFLPKPFSSTKFAETVHTLLHPQTV